MSSALLSQVLQQIIIVLCLGAGDRVRGDTYDLLFSRWFDRLAYAWLVAALFGHPWDAHTVAIVLAMVAGMTPGWGNAIGPALQGQRPNPHLAEWWQRGVLLRNAWAALTVRGLMWGVCFVPLGVWLDARYFAGAIAFSVAMPAAVWVANRLGKNGGNWEHQEYLRGWIAGTLIVLQLWLWP